MCHAKCPCKPGRDATADVNSRFFTLFNKTFTIREERHLEMALRPGPESEADEQ